MKYELESIRYTYLAVEITEIYVHIRREFI